MKTNDSIKSVSINPHVDESELATFTTQIDHMAVLLGQDFAVLTSKARRQVPKARRMMFQVIPTLVGLARRYGVEPSAVNAVQGQLRLYEAVKPLADRVRTFSQLLDDMLLTWQGAAWSEARGLYTQLKGKATTNSALALELAPVVAAFRISRKNAPNPKPASTPPAKEPPATPASAPPPAPAVVNDEAKPAA